MTPNKFPSKQPPAPAGKQPTPGWIEPRIERGQTPEIAAFQQRLAAAERQLRSMRAVTAVMSGVGIFAMVSVGLLASLRPGQAVSGGSTVTAPFRVVDDQGRVLLHVVNGTEGPQLRVFDRANHPVASLDATRDGGAFSVEGQGGSSTATLIASDTGGQLTLSDRSAQPAAWMGARRNGGSLTFWSASGQDTVSMGADGPALRRDLRPASTTQPGAPLPGDMPRTPLRLPQVASSYRSDLSPQANLPVGSRAAGHDTGQMAPQQARADRTAQPARHPIHLKSQLPETVAHPVRSPHHGRCGYRGHAGHHAAGPRLQPAVTRPGTKGLTLAVAGASLRPMEPKMSSRYDRARLRLAGKLSDLAEEYDGLNSPVQAEFCCRKAVILYLRVLGPDHLLTIEARHQVAVLCREQHHFAEAERLFRLALADYRKSLGASHLRVAACLAELGELYKVQQRYAEARSMYRKSLDCYNDGQAHPTPEAARVRQAYAQVLQQLALRPKPTDEGGGGAAPPPLLQPAESKPPPLAPKSVQQ